MTYFMVEVDDDKTDREQALAIIEGIDEVKSYREITEEEFRRKLKC